MRDPTQAAFGNASLHSANGRLVVIIVLICSPAAGGTHGYDGAKKIVGRKRHIAVDVDGRLLSVGITTADIADSAGAQAILDALRERWPWVKHLFADGAYDRLQLMEKAAFLAFTLEIAKRTEAGFKILPRRWVVERTSGLADALPKVGP